MAKFYCKYCGRQESSIQTLTSMTCSKSPNKYHQPYEGSELSKYSCKYCGRQESSIQTLASMSCSKSDNGYHQPA